jgi:hypothetical protein
MSGLDREALFVAMVIAPTTYARNRFFDLYKDPEVRRLRRRAAQIRSIVRHVTRASAAEPAERLTFAPADDGRTELRYTVPTIALRRVALLDPIELALVRFAIARAEGGLAYDDPDRARVEAALARLAPVTGADAGTPAPRSSAPS